MRSLTVALGERGYPIHIGPDLLGRADLVLPHLTAGSVAVISNTTVAPLYMARFTTPLRGAGVAVTEIVLPDGEAYKTLDTLDQVFDGLLRAHCERKTALIAIGGGVIGDLTGFAAATYLRGVPFIQVPTTLLSQVDSSVGGKTGVNHALGKNMIGAFYQPRLVLADTDTLATLPDAELAAGLAEVIKYGLIRDLPFLEWLESHMPALVARDTGALIEAIERSCRNKAEVVAEDEHEGGVRALLNLGHTFGHAIETAAGYGNWLHGHAVAAGALLAAETSRGLGWIGEADVARITELFRCAGLPLQAPNFGVERYLELMAKDKKVEAGRIRFVLLKALGEAVVSAAVPPELLREVLSGRFIAKVD
jgi:3-dehydroquinate synthase